MKYGFWSFAITLGIAARGGHLVASLVLLGAVLGLLLAWLGLRTVREWFSKRRIWKASQDWPSVPGRIVKPGSELFGPGKARSQTDRQKPATAFLYTVDGLPYEKRLDSKTGHRPGEEIEVFYNPKEPMEAVHSRAYPSGNRSRLVVGLCFCTIGCSLTFGGGYVLLAR
jgi:hypothetical protein